MIEQMPQVDPIIPKYSKLLAIEVAAPGNVTARKGHTTWAKQGYFFKNCISFTSAGLLNIFLRIFLITQHVFTTAACRKHLFAPKDSKAQRFQNKFLSFSVRTDVISFARVFSSAIASAARTKSLATPSRTAFLKNCGCFDGAKRLPITEQISGRGVRRTSASTPCPHAFVVKRAWRNAAPAAVESRTSGGGIHALPKGSAFSTLFSCSTGLPLERQTTL